MVPDKGSCLLGLAEEKEGKDGVSTYFGTFRDRPMFNHISNGKLSPSRPHESLAIFKNNQNTYGTSTVLFSHTKQVTTPQTRCFVFTVYTKKTGSVFTLFWLVFEVDLPTAVSKKTSARAF